MTSFWIIHKINNAFNFTNILKWANPWDYYMVINIRILENSFFDLKIFIKRLKNNHPVDLEQFWKHLSSFFGKINSIVKFSSSNSNSRFSIWEQSLTPKHCWTPWSKLEQDVFNSICSWAQYVFCISSTLWSQVLGRLFAPSQKQQKLSHRILLFF